jgi:hypothetical protein
MMGELTRLVLVRKTDGLVDVVVEEGEFSFVAVEKTIIERNTKKSAKKKKLVTWCNLERHMYRFFYAFFFSFFFLEN